MGEGRLLSWLVGLLFGWLVWWLVDLLLFSSAGLLVGLYHDVRHQRRLHADASTRCEAWKSDRSKQMTAFIDGVRLCQAFDWVIILDGEMDLCHR